MNRRVLALAGLLTLVAAALATAQAPRVTRSRLPNGLAVIVRENSAAPVVAFSLLVKMGTRTETQQDASISNMLQIMLVRGTEKMNGEQIAAAADRMGGSIDAYGDADYSEIAATALARNWMPMLELVADVALRPTIPDGTVSPVRDFLLRQIRNRGDKPFDVGVDQTRVALFGADHPYAWDPLGRRESVERLTRDALLAHYRRHYTPEQMVLAVSGDVKAAEVFAQVQRLFASMPPGTAQQRPLPAPAPMSAGREVFIVPGAQAQIFMAAQAPAFSHPDYAPLKVMTALLGGGWRHACSPTCATSRRWRTRRGRSIHRVWTRAASPRSWARRRRTSRKPKPRSASISYAFKTSPRRKRKWPSRARTWWAARRWIAVRTRGRRGTWLPASWQACLQISSTSTPPTSGRSRPQTSSAWPGSIWGSCASSSSSRRAADLRAESPPTVASPLAARFAPAVHATRRAPETLTRPARVATLPP